MAGFSDWLALSSILEGNALEKRCLDTLPGIKTAYTITSYCATTPSCDANCTVMPCHPLILAIMIPCAVIHMTCLSLFCYLKPQVRSKLTGSSPSQATAFVKENWDDQIISMKKVTSTKERSTGQTILENNHSSKRDWRQAENWKDTLQIWLQQWCCYWNFSLYSESKGLSRQGSGTFVSETAGQITTPLLHT